MPHRISIINALVISAILTSGIATGLFWTTGVEAQSKPRVNTIVLSPSSVVGGAGVTCSITLTANAPAGGVTVTITNSNTTAVTVPSSVAVLQGQISTSVPITTRAVATATSAVITATANSGSKSATLTISAPTLTSVRLNPTSVLGGNSSTGTVILSGAAPTGGMVVSLQSALTSIATVPDSVTVASGATSANFPVTTSTVQTTTSTSINATLNAVTQSATITVEAPNRPPTVNLTAPASGQSFTSPATIILNAAASDTDGIISRVRFFRNGTLINDDVTAPYSYTWNNVATGNYSLTAVAVDNKGATATSQAVTVTVSSESTGNITRFTERAAFDKASADRTIITFEGLAPPGGFTSYDSPGSLTTGGVFFSTNNYLFIQNNNFFGTGSIFSAQQGSHPQVVNIALPANVTAVGSDFFSAVPVQITLSTGQRYTLQGNPLPNFAFAGFTSTIAISSVQFVANNGIDLDNFVYGRGLPNPTVQIAALDAVAKNGTGSVVVNITPTTNEIPVTLRLQTTSGTGEARFANDTTQITLTETTTVQIKGVTESSAVDNIRLEAKVGDTSLVTEDFSVTMLEITSPKSTGAINRTTQNALLGAAVTLQASIIPSNLSGGTYTWTIDGPHQIAGGSTSGSSVQVYWTEIGNYTVSLNYLNSGVTHAETMTMNVVLPTLTNFSAHIYARPDADYTVLAYGVGNPWFMLGNIRAKIDGIKFSATVQSSEYISEDGSVKYLQIVNGTHTRTSVTGACTEYNSSNGEWILDSDPYTTSPSDMGTQDPTKTLKSTASGAETTIVAGDSPGQPLERDHHTTNQQFEMYVVYFVNGIEVPLGYIPWSWGGEVVRDAAYPYFREFNEYPTDVPKDINRLTTNSVRPYNKDKVFNNLTWTTCP